LLSFLVSGERGTRPIVGKVKKREKKIGGGMKDEASLNYNLVENDEKKEG